MKISLNALAVLLVVAATKLHAQVSSSIPPHFGPSLPSSSSGDVHYKYTYSVNPNQHWAICGDVSSVLDGYTTETATVGQATVKDRGYAERHWFNKYGAPCEPSMGLSKHRVLRNGMTNPESYSWPVRTLICGDSNCGGVALLALDQSDELYAEIVTASASSCLAENTVESITRGTLLSTGEYSWTKIVRSTTTSTPCYSHDSSSSCSPCNVTEHVEIHGAFYEVEIWVKQGYAGPSYSGPGASVKGEMTIAPNQLPLVQILSMSNASDNNGSGGVTDGIVRVSRKGSTSSALTVYFSRSGTATPPGQTGEDYQIGIGGTFGNFTSVTIPSGSSYIDFLIHPVYDSYNVDGTESVVISLSASSAYTVDIQGVASTTPIY